MAATRSKVMFLLALLFAGAAAWLANLWVQRNVMPAPSAVAIEMQNIVVAAMDIPYGQVIESQHIKTVQWPKHLLPTGALHTPEAAVGQVARQAIVADDVVTQSRIAQHLDGSHLAALVNSNKRAMSVRVDDVVGVSGFLLPGNHVDVVGVRVDRSTGAAKVDTVLQDVVVLAVDQDISPEKDKPKIVRAVTLEVTPEQSETLIKASHEGTIQLTLRNPGDRTIAAAPAPIPKPAMKVVTKQAPAPVEPAPFKVTVIRGTAVSEEKL